MSSSYVYRAQKRRFCLLLTKYLSINPLLCKALKFSFVNSFLTYCDYMAITILHEIIRKSFQFFADILKAHDISGPSEYELLNTVINRKLEEPRPTEYPQVYLDRIMMFSRKNEIIVFQKSLLIARLVLTPEKVEIDPSRLLFSACNWVVWLECYLYPISI